MHGSHFLGGAAEIVIEPARSWPKTTMPINLGEDMPQQPSLLDQTFSP